MSVCLCILFLANKQTETETEIEGILPMKQDPVVRGLDSAIPSGRVLFAVYALTNPPTSYIPLDKKFFRWITRKGHEAILKMSTVLPNAAKMCT